VVLAVPRPRDAQSDGGHCRSEARFRPASDAPVPRLGDHLRWRIAGVSRAGRRARTDQKRRREIGRGAHWQEPTPPVGRVAAAVGIRPAGWLRGCERRRSVVPRSGDALGGRRQSGPWIGLPQPARWAASRPNGWQGRKTSPRLPICRANGSTRCTSGVSRGSSCSIWIRARARLTAHRKAAPTMGISAAPVIIRCSCSTSSAIWSGAPCARATCTAPLVVKIKRKDPGRTAEICAQPSILWAPSV